LVNWEDSLIFVSQIIKKTKEMSKLNTFRDEKAYNYGWIEKVSKFTSKVLTVYLANSSEKDFKKGWDAHEALNLPVLFAEWCRYGKYEAYKNIIRDCTSRGLSSEDTTKELYDSKCLLFLIPYIL